MLSGPASKKTTPPQRSVRAMAGKAVLLQLLQLLQSVFPSCRAGVEPEFSDFFAHFPPILLLGASHTTEAQTNAKSLGYTRTHSFDSLRQHFQIEGSSEREREREREIEREIERERTKQYSIECVESLSSNYLYVLVVKESVVCVCCLLLWRDTLCDISGGSWMKHASLALSATRC